MIEQTINIPIYDAVLYVVIATSYDEFEQAVHDTGYVDPLNGAGMITLRHEETPAFHIIMNSDDISPGNIAHECLHVTNKLMHHLNIIYDWFNDEAMCYLHGFLVDCVHKIIEDETTGD
jgi:hypothetical protein